MIIVSHFFHLLFICFVSHLHPILNSWILKRLDVDQEQAGTLTREFYCLCSNGIHESGDTLLIV